MTSSGIVDINIMLAQIEQIKADPDTDYGYIKMTYALKTIGYYVNKKRVYCLMSCNGLLKSKNKVKPKNYVKYRKVLPERPLEVLEMDIKFVWVEQYKRHAFVITIIDTFTRHALYHNVFYSIKKYQVKECWDYVVENYLQAYLYPGEYIHVEVRNDNDKRFSAKLVQDYFAENHINQVFTHPYTPQENGHIESFHSILSKHLEPYNFWSIEELEQNLILFYEKYNNSRIHSSIAYLSPRNFWDLWNKDLIQKKTDYKMRINKFKLKIPYDEIYQHTGNNEPEVAPLHNKSHRNGAPIKDHKEMDGAETSHNIRYKKSPSVVPCDANI
ncbi:MAG: integrase core domain-containing protein [Bacteroidales bacterium]|nr:integrase core domain-containing protein [Bacteroidales bacterium]NCU40065.1 transposase [Candidatus Falkowbacteria bacterium]